MFSVVMPLWNKRHTVESTVASALAQTVRDFELIIVDDGSTDGGMAALERFDDPRILKLAQANAGPGPARNAGIEAARHDWIAFLDADDIWLPDHLAELGRIRESHPRAGLIGTAFVSQRLNGSVHLAVANGGAIEAIDYIDRAGSGEWPFCTSSTAIRKAVFAELGGFADASICQDLEYWARIALERPVAVSRRVTAVYRRGTGGISDTRRSPWLGQDLRDVRDVGPSVAVLVDRYPTIGSPERRGAIDRYVDRRLRWCVRVSARIGDLRTLRAVPRLYLRPPVRGDRLILAIARLPAPLARAAYWLGFRGKALLRLARRRWAASPAREPGCARAGGRHGRAGG